MSPSPLKRTALAALMLLAPGAAVAAVRGYVELPWTPTTCLQGSHFLTDPCTGRLALLDDYQAIDLDPYVCRYVIVDGPNVGIECTVTAPLSVVPSPPPCSVPFGDLWFNGAIPPQLIWDHVTCAAGYDVIRGDLASLSSGISQTHLGAVACLGNDVPQDDWWSISGPADAEDPPIARAFFYLVRARSLVLGDETYGFSSDGKERVPSSGNCPF